MKLKNFVLYVPEEGTEQHEVYKMINAEFYKDEEGNDWYEIQKELIEAHKESDQNWSYIVYDSNGVIILANKDITALYPLNCSVAAVPNMEDITPDGIWSYSGTKVYRRELSSEEVISKAEKERSDKMKSIKERIDHLKDAADDGDITEEEEVEFERLVKYRIALRRLDVSKVSEPDFEWPVLEEVK